MIERNSQDTPELLDSSIFDLAAQAGVSVRGHYDED